MRGLLDVVVLHVRDNPEVAGILAVRIPRQLPAPRPFEVSLARILGRHSDWVEIELVSVGLCKPIDGFVSTRQSLRAMQPVLEVPDNAVAHLEAVVFEDAIQRNVQRHYFALLDVISHLPANRSFGMEQPHTFGDHCRLFLNVLIERRTPFVRFTDIVGWRRDDERYALVRQCAHESEIVLASQNCGLVGLKTLNVEQS